MAERSRRRNPAKERLWREVIGRQRTSGLSIAEFCLRERVSQASFHNWRREIARRNAETPKAADVGKPRHRSASKAVPASRSQAPAFLPVVVKEAASAASVEIVLPDRTTVRVPPGCDGPTLVLILAALAEQRATPGSAADADRDREVPPC
jgi:hypothetical protein